MAFGTTLTVTAATGTLADFPSLIRVDGTRNDLPSGAYTGGDAFTNGGGNFVAYTDSGKGTRLSVDVVTFDTTTPNIEVWVKVPSMATSATIYVEADAVQISQPAFGAAFGRDSTWPDADAVYHFADTTGLDSTGNSNDLTSGTYTVASGPVGNQLDDGHAYNSLGVTSTISTGATVQQWVTQTVATNKYTVQVQGPSGFIGLMAWNGDWQWYDGNFSGGPAYVLNTPALMHITTNASTTDFYINGILQNSKATELAKFTGIDRIYVSGNASDSTGIKNDEFRLSTTFFSADRALTEYNNQAATTAWYSNNGWVDAGGGTVDNLLADDLESASEVTSATIGQAHALSATSIQSLSELTTPALSTGGEYNLLADDIQSLSTVSSVSVGQTHNLLANDLSSNSEITSPSLSTGGTDNLLADDLESATQASTVSISQVHALLATGVDSSSEVEQGVIGQAHVLSALSLVSLSELSIPEINRPLSIVPAIRIRVIGAESRIMSTLAETRTRSIGSENRTKAI